MSASLVAEPKAVGEARKLLRGALCDRGIDGQRVQDVLIVASELVANAIVHGIRRGDRVELEFKLAHDRIFLCVRDAGRARAVPQVLPSVRSAMRGVGSRSSLASRVGRSASWTDGAKSGPRKQISDCSAGFANARSRRPHSRQAAAG
jgi:hypothetical protein